MKMSSTRTLALALMVGGLAISSAQAASDDEAATSASAARAASPGLLPLPEISSSWSKAYAYPAAGIPNYASLAPVVDPGYGRMAAVTWYQPAPAGPPMRPTPDASHDVYNGLQTPAACAECAGDCGCDSGCGCHGFWYGYAGGLMMTRNQPNKFWTTYNQANNNFQNLNTEEANVHWDGGPEFTVGYRCCCDGGIELTYWGIWDMNGSVSITDPNNNLGTPMDVTNGAAGLLLGGQTPDSFFTNAHQMFIWRHDEVHNVEINLTYNPWGYDNCGWNATWLAGVRLFKFDENLLWTSVAGGFDLGSNGGANQANLNIHCENDMAGFQIGGVINYRFNNRLSIFGVPKIGIYGNAAETQSRYYRGDGIVGFDITGHKDTVSFLGSFDLGLNYDVGCHWSLVGGYRVVVVSGVALADNQIPHFLAAADEFADVKTNGDLILHGAFFGASFHY
jgi:hypothetical protein